MSEKQRILDDFNDAVEKLVDEISLYKNFTNLRARYFLTGYLKTNLAREHIFEHLDFILTGVFDEKIRSDN